MAVSINATAQTLNFGIADGTKVYWQKVFESSMDEGQITKLLVNDGRFTDIINNEGVITCRLVDAVIDYKKMGFPYSDTPMYISKCKTSLFATIQVKDGKYRVTVENVVFVVAEENGIFKIGETDPLEDYAIKKGAFRNMFLHANGAEILNRYFTETFKLQEKSFLNDEW